MYDDVLNVKIGKRRRADQDTTYRIIKLKLKHRKRMLRIRANDFERGNELIKEFLRIKHQQAV
jgi:hypothetical protein